MKARYLVKEEGGLFVVEVGRDYIGSLSRDRSAAARFTLNEAARVLRMIGAEDCVILRATRPSSKGEKP